MTRQFTQASPACEVHVLPKLPLVSGGAQLKRNPDTPALLRSGFLNEIVDFPGGVCGLQAGSGSLHRANDVVQPRRLRRTAGSQPEVERRVAGGDRLVTGMIRK